MKILTMEKSERNLIVNILAAFAIKGVSLLISVFSTPQYIRYFGDNTVLGVWYTILSVLTWITICDLGLGNGLRNKLTQALAANDNSKAKGYISSAYISIIAIIAPIAAIGSTVIQFIDFNAILKLPTELISPEVLKLSITVLFAGVCLSFVLKTVHSILYAIQQSSVTNFLALITSLIPLIYISVFKGESIESNLIALSIVHVLASCLPSLVATFTIFTRSLRECAPSPKHFAMPYAKDVMGLGIGFFGAQIFFMLLMSTNEIMINTFFLPDYVVEYNIYYKVFTTIGSLFMLALTPLWSKVTQDVAKKRFHIVRKTNKLLYLVSGLAFIAQFAILPFLQWFLDFWLQENTITVDMATAAIFALFGGVYIFNNAINTIANGMGDLKSQVIIYGITSVLKIPFVMLLSSIYPSWNIIVLYNAVSLIVFCTVQFVLTETKIRRLAAASLANSAAPDAANQGTE